MMWCMGCTCSEIHIKGFIWRERLLRIHPGNRLIGHIGGEMIIRIIHIRKYPS